MHEKYKFVLLIKLLMIKNIILSSAFIVQDTFDMLEIIGNKTISSIVLNNSTSFHSIWSAINKFQSRQYETNYNFEINHQAKLSIVSSYEKKLNDYFSRIQFLRDRSEDWSTLLRRNTLSLDDSTTDIISNDDDYPRSVLTKLHNLFFGRISELITGHDYNHLLQSINKLKCNMNSSKQHQLYSLYNTILFTEVQAFSVLAFAYMWRSINILTKFDYTNEMAIDMNDSRNRILDYTRLFKKEMKIASNFIRRCDPFGDHEKGRTYDTFDNLMYSFVTNQRHLEPSQNTNCKSSCKTTTPNRRFCELHGASCSINNHWYDNTCPGKIYDCEYASSTKFEVCRREQFDESSTRLFHWFKNENNGTIYGDAKRKCASTEEICEEKYSWLPWSNTCDVCVCKCLDNRIDTESNSIRAFSLLQSRTSDNMIATGARLVAKDRMVHIQLREAKLLPYGKIDKTTEKWVPLPTFIYKDNFPNGVVQSNGFTLPLERDKDFVLLGRNFEDNICFQKLAMNVQYLLTGVKFGIGYFKNNKNQSKFCIKLEAEYILHDFQDGTFDADTKYHLDTFLMPLSQLVFNKPDNPLKFKKNMKDSEDNQFVTISVSDFVKDASQSTIPFIDLLEVTPNPSVPINGIQLFHKGQINDTSGGFISLKIYPLDFTTHLDL